MRIPRVLSMNSAFERDLQGQLLGSSRPFGVLKYTIREEQDEGSPDRALPAEPGKLFEWLRSCGENTLVATRTEAGEIAENWARQRRVHMALAYSRRTGRVVAQYYQSWDGLLAYLLYTPHGRLEEQYNAHLFESLPEWGAQEPDQAAMEEYARLPFVQAAPTCTYPVRDDAGTTEQEWWFAQRPSNSGVWLSAYPDRPTDTEEGGEAPLLTAIIEVYGGKLRIRWWDRQNLEGEPNILVVEPHLATLPLTRLAVLHFQGIHP
jgi:hypothetical protein